ncbi:hypothetical protein Patl1_35392 [Pistacia atlantica]|nr:hypothetical protein Patl1_35392 [Pistacia atlantica]
MDSRRTAARSKCERESRDRAKRVVAFRAKFGKRPQLPHKGNIPEEFGVIARYKGQGRLAEPGFRNPRWVVGELVILDGKHLYIKGGPVVGFVYWAPEYHFLVFFNRLRLQR